MEKKTAIIIAITVLLSFLVGINIVHAEEDVMQIPDDRIDFVIGFFRSGEGGSGQGAIFLTGEDVEKHKGGIFCVERGKVIPYKYHGNAGSSIGKSSSKDTDMTAETNDGSNSVIAWESSFIRILLTQYDGDKVLNKISSQYANSHGIYEPTTTRDMTLAEQYIFSHADNDVVQEALWDYNEKQYSSLPTGGTASSIVQEALTYEEVIKNIKSPSLSSNNATVAYSFDKEEFLIGPFSLDYTRYYIYGCDDSDVVAKYGRKINFSGIIGATLYLDDRDIKLSAGNFMYPNGRTEEANAESGYVYPYPEETFYIRLSVSEAGDAKQVERISFKFQKFIEGEGTVTELEGTYLRGYFVAKHERVTCPGYKITYSSYKCNPDYCPGPTDGNPECDHGMTSAHGECEHGYSSSHTVNTQEKGPCDHGYFEEHVIGIKEWLEYDGSTTHDSQKLIKVSAVAAIYKTYNSATMNLSNLSLRMNYGGTVWEDEHTGKMQDQDGQIGYRDGIRTENGIPNIKVTIYDQDTGEACGSTYTDSNGNYLFTDLKIAKYYAEFEYDGQTWEPTTYFAGGEDNFATNSKAQENDQERIAFNNKFNEIIETGALSTSENLQNILYNTQTPGKSFAITNDDGKVEGDYYSFFKMTATTMDDNNNIISYPRENDIHLEDYDKVIAGTTYVALYPKIENINLGLARRTTADFEVRKDVYKAIVQINGKTEEYTYSSRDNITESFDIDVKMGPDYEAVEYNRAIYRSDYNYRISDYNNNELNQGVGEAIYNAKQSQNDELRIYIIYKITVANRSNVYAGIVNELVDYYDAEYTYTGESWYGTPQSVENTVTWTTAPKYNAAKSFNGYNTLYTQTTSNLMINSGEMLNIYMKFEVNKHTDESGKENSVILDETLNGDALGGKNNVVEITNYSTYKEGTTIAEKNIPSKVEGKIEKDSHPGNAEPTNKNTFEDDTDGAPRMNIILHKSEERSIYGYVWEDARTETLQTGQIVGNGTKEDNEKLINGVVVQLIEKVEINGQTYEYIWREMESGSGEMKYLDYNGNLITNGQVENPETGKYFFDKYVPGNYIVRFIYGDNNSTIQTSANGGRNDISYNGQDYKSTIYKAVLKENGYYDLGNNQANTSKAKDNAIRRLNVNKYSETMNNHIGSVLAAPYATPNDTALIQELRDNTWMYADTAYIHAEVAYNTTTTELAESQNISPVYKVENVSFGLEERPRTNIVLTKQIENATITLSNGTVLMDTASGIKNGIKILPNKYTHSQTGKRNQIGLWSYEIDDELIQGAELKIYYRLTVDNNGQIDTVGQNYDLNNIPSDLNAAEAMLGSAYYYGTTQDTQLVTTSINKIIDYIDRSIAFNKDTESNSGVWYSVENIDDLKAVGLIDQSVQITDETSNNTMAMTEILKDNKLNPSNNQTASLGLVLTKILGGNSTDYDYTYGNIAEVIEITNTVGRRDPDQIPGNADPNDINKDENTPAAPELENDTDISENFTITTPTGKNQSMIYYIVGIIAAIVLAGGVILIKKFALGKK